MSIATRITRREYEMIRELVYGQSGISLGDAKQSLVESRLSKRLVELGLKSYRDYYRWLQENDESGTELQLMINCITTNKTDFFREPHHFEFLEKRVLANRVRQSKAGAPRRLRVWSAASSRGHEPYSIAATILDAIPDCGNWDVRILATDINTDVLDYARRGIYSASDITPIPYEKRRRHFLCGTGNRTGWYAVKSQLKDRISFQRMNLVHDRFRFRDRFDVIFLRNVMIYFDRDTQQRVLEQMKPWLHADGYLILGHSENICWHNSGYAPLGATIYRLEETQP